MSRFPPGPGESTGPLSFQSSLFRPCTLARWHFYHLKPSRTTTREQSTLGAQSPDRPVRPRLVDKLPGTPLRPDLEFVPFNPERHFVNLQGRYLAVGCFSASAYSGRSWVSGSAVVPLLAGLGTLWASYRLALAVGVSRTLAWLAVPLVGLATPVPLYSMLYFEHTVASLLVTLSMLAAVGALNAKQRTEDSEATRKRSRLPRALAPIAGRMAPSEWLAALRGILLAFAVYFRSELYVLAVVLFGALVFVGLRRGVGWQTPLCWAVSFALALVPLWAFYALTEGTLLPTHALWYFTGSEPSGEAGSGSGIPALGLPPLRYIATAGWGVIPAFLLGPQTAPLAPSYPAWVEWACILGTVLCISSGLISLTGERARRLRVPIFGLGLILVLVSTAAVLLSPQQYYNLHGFLLASPFLALALWPGATGKSGRFLYAVTWLYVGLHALIISALSGLGPISLHEWGQRYLLPAYPLLVVLSLLALADLSRTVRAKSVRLKWAVPALYGLLVLVGVGFAARGYVMLREERLQVVTWLDLVRTLPPTEPVVTDVWWLPLNLAADFYPRPFMLAEGDARLTKWAGEMRTEESQSSASPPPTQLRSAASGHATCRVSRPTALRTKVAGCGCKATRFRQHLSARIS